MDDFELEIKKDFLNEALMNLEEVESSFMELETTSDPAPLLEKIFRLAHNLKGGSTAVGFEQIAELTHQLESLVLKIQKNEIALGSELITTLLQSNDTLVHMHRELKTNIDAKFENSQIISEIKMWIEGKKTTSSQAPPHAKEEILDIAPKPIAPSADQFFQEEAAQVHTAPTSKPEPRVATPPSDAKKSGSNDQKSKDDEIIRVSMSKIDLLNDYVGELIVLQSVVDQQANAEDPRKLTVSIRQMIKIAKDIQSLSMSLRMLPIKPLVQKLQRVVRDTAQSLGKEVALEVVGDQLDIDKSVLDKLADPLIHILRNAVDHGLEVPADRTASNKATQGKIALTFLNNGNQLVVEAKDDGRGIDLNRIRAKAIEKGIVTEAQQLSEKQLINLIFHPGFSTKTEVSEISGRGVGMDVVRTNLEKIGGTIDIKTSIGLGSTFVMQIPLTLAVIEGLVVASEKNRYVIPLAQVQETINLRSRKLFTDKLGIGSCFELRGSIVPLVSIEQALHPKSNSAPVNLEGTALIIQIHDKSVALVVNDVIKSQQIVIKPFSNGLVAQKGWVGSCVLGDGLPTLILSPIELLSHRMSTEQRNRLEGAA